MSINRALGVPLPNITTFRMGGNAREVVTLETESDIQDFFENLPENEKWFMLGGGSNVVFPDGDCDVTLLKLASGEIKTEEKGDEVLLAIPAGNNWDDVVAFAVSKDLSGIEALSAIPGTAGATPIQNVGAYGAEIADVLVSLRAYDAKEKKFVGFKKEDCHFGYRDSIFKHEGKGRYIITEIALCLSKDLPNVPQYPGVADYLAKNDIRAASLLDIRKAIISIRANKLPDPKEIASVGSFFKNAFVPKEQAEKLKAEFPTLAVFPVNEKISKVGAGSLIDTLGYKGKKLGNLSIYHGNALVIVNDGGATRAELSGLVSKIIAEVKEKFGITLEPEPELLNF